MKRQHLVWLGCAKRSFDQFIKGSLVSAHVAVG